MNAVKSAVMSVLEGLGVKSPSDNAAQDRSSIAALDLEVTPDPDSVEEVDEALRTVTGLEDEENSASDRLVTAQKAVTSYDSETQSLKDELKQLRRRHEPSAEESVVRWTGADHPKTSAIDTIERESELEQIIAQRSPGLKLLQQEVERLCARHEQAYDRLVQAQGGVVIEAYESLIALYGDTGRIIAELFAHKVLPLVEQMQDAEHRLADLVNAAPQRGDGLGLRTAKHGLQNRISSPFARDATEEQILGQMVIAVIQWMQLDEPCKALWQRLGVPTTQGSLLLYVPVHDSLIYAAKEGRLAGRAKIL